MRAALAESLEHIWAVTAGHINLAAADVTGGLSEIRAHRVSPGVFGRYYDLVFAVQDRRFDDAGALFREIVDVAAKQPRLAVLPFSADALGADQERYARLLSLETEVPLAAPQADEWRGFEESVTAALALIEEADAVLAAELRAVIVQIVGAISAAQNGGRRFGGASSFMLWGAVVLNVRQHSNRLEMLAGLVHEAAHQLLFGLSIDEPLVENPIDERYGSPLRSDPRPMDGIFHATFVCARMHYAYARLMDAAKNSLSQAERDFIAERLRDHRRKFLDGRETLQRFGRLTNNGDRILSAAADYMQSAGS